MIVGLAAKSGLARNGPSTVIHNKKLLNEKIEETELEEMVNASACKVKHEEGSVRYEIKRGDKLCSFTPEDVAVCIFKKMYDIASSAVRSEADLRAVLAIPLHFQQNSRQTVMRSAEEAGFEVLQVISEPSAAVLAYGVGLSNLDEEHHCLVYRLGGETLDVTVVQVSAGMYTISGTVHKSNLGGNTFTRILADYLAGEFRHRWKLDPQESRRSMVKLRSTAETCKHILSTVSTAHCFVESLCEGVDFSYNITRARFENLITSHLSEYMQPVHEVLKKSGLSSKLITKLILSGGAMKMPKLQQAVGDLFPESEVLSGISPDEVIATGAARQGSYLARPFDPDCEHLAIEVPAVSKPICVKVSEEIGLKCIIPALTPVPVKRIQTHTITSEQSDVTVELYETDGNSCGAPLLFGKVHLFDIVGPTKISIEVSLNSVGGMHVIVTDHKSQKKQTWKLEV
ncbi:heat shock 70 kDa protein 14-like isoform X2 [Zootermopsis nevadensis]|nr:heat shock 70 kDa protein 14-like isoform X2 [Zootermopsis nevadensis]XP_021923590.1 heat shock 70 kDa protein 14-like isoform X2 [Zootermopsis nevadensis]